MKKTANAAGAAAQQQESRCENCGSHDEKRTAVTKLISRHKAENDHLSNQLKNLSEESKKVIEKMVLLKNNSVSKQSAAVPDSMSEEVNKKTLEVMKKQLESYERRIKQNSTKEGELTFEDVFQQAQQANQELEKQRQLNEKLKKQCRDQEKQPSKSTMQLAEVKKAIEGQIAIITDLQKTIAKKNESKTSILKKIDEIEAKYKEICTKNNIPPITRPDFKFELEELSSENAKRPSDNPAVVKTLKPNKPLVKESPIAISEAILKNKQEALVKAKQAKKTEQLDKAAAAPPAPAVPEITNVTAEMVVKAQEQLKKLQKNVESYEKVHNITMTDLENKEFNLLQDKEKLQEELDSLLQECTKAQAVLKELQGMPAKATLEASSVKNLRGLGGEFSASQSNLNEEGAANLNTSSVAGATSSSSLLNAKTLLMNKNKFKRELHGAKLITEKSSLWADYNSLPQERSYRLQGLKWYYKATDIVRVELEYVLASGEVIKSVQPANSESAITEKDMKCVDIRLARNENIMELEGIHDTMHILYLRIKTSTHKEYTIGTSKINVKLKEFKFKITHLEKPISLFGCFDLAKGYEGSRKVLAQLGIEIMKKEMNFDSIASKPTNQPASLKKSSSQENVILEQNDVGENNN